LQPSVDELYDLVVSFGFDILYWKIDVNLVAYRHYEDPVDASFVRASDQLRSLPSSLISSYSA
jgi:hypothetical protein